jgi:hypothetical protein
VKHATAVDELERLAVAGTCRSNLSGSRQTKIWHAIKEGETSTATNDRS